LSRQPNLLHLRGEREEGEGGLLASLSGKKGGGIKEEGRLASYSSFPVPSNLLKGEKGKMATGGTTCSRLSADPIKKKKRRGERDDFYFPASTISLKKGRGKKKEERRAEFLPYHEFSEGKKGQGKAGEAISMVATGKKGKRGKGRKVRWARLLSSSYSS